MAYSENPRKIYGKVEVIYADEELSRDITTEESGNSEISYPTEVYHLPSEPTVKACTMDGNATMDGTFQMMDDSVLCGWWSGKLSDADGVFKDKPYIELKFTNRPIIYWKVIGDCKLNQYPVDFTVDYKRNGTVVKTESIEGNTDLERVLEPRIADITSVRLTAFERLCQNLALLRAVIRDIRGEFFAVIRGGRRIVFRGWELQYQLGYNDGQYLQRRPQVR